jgi:hypothetical protein
MFDANLGETVPVHVDAMIPRSRRRR